jgi:hypothetical protein
LPAAEYGDERLFAISVNDPDSTYDYETGSGRIMENVVPRGSQVRERIQIEP